MCADNAKQLPAKGLFVSLFLPLIIVKTNGREDVLSCLGVDGGDDIAAAAEVEHLTVDDVDAFLVESALYDLLVLVEHSLLFLA